MRIGQITATGSRPNDLPAQDAQTSPAGESRALVALTPAATGKPSENHRQATFLAHLIAVKDRLPQTCARRRTEPAEAIAAYRASAALTER